ncbi:ABC transporter substrate-binding protein [Paenibacillus durus]|uniref:ABC transporter substrate-binding protein n=1 Tax=Paenibacillus durus ATCC 35681 TaxID=1333534 RepID=A0A0F7F994_PAEDU|nr:ABC transporter substrate-binding protein [Paenibacillus durus]AKG34354.1 ABC transporter substrate-binding protein [Paenibacillus durus ATCC 35681]
MKKFGWMCLVFLILLTACRNSKDKAANMNSGGGNAGQETVELTMAFHYFGSVPQDLGLVEEEVNKITEKKLNIKVKFLLIGFSAWQQQMNLMLTGGESLDLIVTGTTPVFSFTPQVAKGQLLPLNDLIGQYGKGIRKVMDPAWLSAGQIRGNIYGIPSLREMAGQSGFMMRTDLLQKYNIDASKLKTVEDVEKVLALIHEKESDLIPLAPHVPDEDFVSTLSNWDTLGNGLGVLMNYGDNLHVVNLYETPEYKQRVELYHKWFQAGYILKDAATYKEITYDLVRNDRVFAYASNIKPGIEMEALKQTGKQMTPVSMTKPYTASDKLGTLMWGIPAESKHPVEAMKLLDLMYTDKELVNLLDWGIEGKHYVKVSDNVIKFPDGINDSNNRYSLNLNFLFGNETLSYVFEGEDPKLWEKMKEYNTNATRSKALGFTMDQTPVKREITAVSNVINQYALGLGTGLLDPDKVLPEFISKLRAAGIDKIITEKQRQLDEWAKQNK